jgi:hypothetical protein
VLSGESPSEVLACVAEPSPELLPLPRRVASVAVCSFHFPEGSLPSRFAPSTSPKGRFRRGLLLPLPRRVASVAVCLVGLPGGAFLAGAAISPGGVVIAGLCVPSVPLPGTSGTWVHRITVSRPCGLFSARILLPWSRS